MKVFSLNTRIILILLVGVPVLLWGIWSLYAPVFAAHKLTNILNELGYARAAVSGSTIKDDVIVFKDVTLSPDEPDTVASITLPRPQLKKVLAGVKPYDSATVDGLTLNRTLDDLRAVTLPQLWLRLGHTLDTTLQFDLEKAEMPVVTPGGTYTFEADGQFAHAAAVNGEPARTLINGKLWSTKNNLVLDSYLKGSIVKDPAAGKSSLQLEINELAFKNGDMHLERGAGWIGLTRQASSPLPALSGQIGAGFAALHNVEFHDMNLTLNGDLANYDLILEARVKIGNGEGYVNGEIKNSAQGPVLHISFATDSRTMVLNFLSSLKQITADAPFKSDIMTPLLLTEGNLGRIEKRLEAEGLNRRLTLTIAGNADNLQGMIDTGQSIISLVP